MSDLGTRWNKSMILLHPCATLEILGDAIFLDFLGTDERAQRLLRLLLASCCIHLLSHHLNDIATSGCIISTAQLG